MPGIAVFGFSRFGMRDPKLSPTQDVKEEEGEDDVLRSRVFRLRAGLGRVIG